MWNGRPCVTGILPVQPRLVERASCPFALARVAGSVRTPPLWNGHLARSEMKATRSATPRTGETPVPPGHPNGRDARSTKTPVPQRNSKGCGSRRSPCRLAFAFALLRVGRDHDLEEELVNARHRRDDQLARRDRHRRLPTKLKRHGRACAHPCQQMSCEDTPRCRHKLLPQRRFQAT